MKRISLRVFQQRFKSAVTGEVTTALESIPIRATTTFTREMRLGVYRYAYLARIEESLAEDFPRVKAALGEVDFRKTVMAFLHAHPSRFASLAEVSQFFPSFLALVFRAVPYISDLARLEWLQVLSGVTDIGEGFDFSELATLPETQQLSVVLKLHPASFLFDSAWNVLEPFEEKGLNSAPVVKQTYVLVYRVGDDVTLETISEEQWKLLRSIANGKTISELSDLLSHVGKSEGDVSEWFSIWARHRVLVCTHANLFGKGTLTEEVI